MSSVLSGQLPITLEVDGELLFTKNDLLTPPLVTMTFPGKGKRPSHFKSRWDDPPEIDFGEYIMSQTGISNRMSGAPQCALPPGMTPEQEEAMVLRVRFEEIRFTIEANSNAIAANVPIPYTGGGSAKRERSPSPPPIYDQTGRRINTIDQRVKERLNIERLELVERARRLHPGFRPPLDFLRLHVKHNIKLIIPEKEHPEFNFTGLVIGPRGITQKKIERESGAKVSIRGRGAHKDGKKKLYPDQPLGDDENSPLYLLISGDSEAQMNKAYNMIKPLLQPNDSSKADWRKLQLVRLAQINGTMTSSVNSGSFGMLSMGDVTSSVSCEICGRFGHSSRNCPMAGGGGNGVPLAKKQKIENDFDAFMSEIGEKPQENKGKSSAELAFDEFLAEIGPEPKIEDDKDEITAILNKAAAASSSAEVVGRSAGVQMAPPPPGTLPVPPPPPGSVQVNVPMTQQQSYMQQQQQQQFQMMPPGMGPWDQNGYYYPPPPPPQHYM